MFTPLSLVTLRPEGRDEGSLDRFPRSPVYAACPVYPEVRREPRREPRSDPRRARRAFPSRSVPCSSDLRALCVSAFSFLPPPFNCSTSEAPNLQTMQSPHTFPDTLATRVKHKSFACHSYEKQPGGGYLRSSNPFLTPIPLSPLTPIESHSSHTPSP